MKKIYLLGVILFATILFTGCGSKDKDATLGNGGVYKSSDSGETFHLSSTVSPEKNLSNASVLNLAINHTDSNIIYAATAAHGIYRSSDGGQNWAESKSDFTYVRKIALDPVNKNIIYIVADQEGERALFKTIDGGINWNKLLSQRTSQTPISLDIIIDPRNTAILYATDSAGGVFKSVDAGKEWASIYWSEDPVKKIIMDAKNSQKLYLLTTLSEIYVSNDGGGSFNISEPEDGFDEIYSITASATEQNVLYVLSRNGLQISKDGGKTYEIVKTLLPPNNTLAHQVVTDPVNSRILYLVAGKIVYKTTNSGATWTSIPLKIKWPVKSFVIARNNSSNIYMGLSQPPKKKSSLFPF
jgi:photosystem II stability/assembly factor-like uncharacterized protein